MLQSGYRLCGFHHILAVPSRSARLLHCAMESLAGSIRHLLLVIRDWIVTTEIAPWKAILEVAKNGKCPLSQGAE